MENKTYKKRFYKHGDLLLDVEISTPNILKYARLSRHYKLLCQSLMRACAKHFVPICSRQCLCDNQRSTPFTPAKFSVSFKTSYVLDGIISVTLDFSYIRGEIHTHFEFYELWCGDKLLDIYDFFPSSNPRRTFFTALNGENCKMSKCSLSSVGKKELYRRAKLAAQGHFRMTSDAVVLPGNPPFILHWDKASGPVCPTT